MFEHKHTSYPPSFCSAVTGVVMLTFSLPPLEVVCTGTVMLILSLPPPCAVFPPNMKPAIFDGKKKESGRERELVRVAGGPSQGRAVCAHLPEALTDSLAQDRVLDRHSSDQVWCIAPDLDCCSAVNDTPALCRPHSAAEVVPARKQLA